MLRVRLEIVPVGDESRAREIGRAEIVNMSDLNGTLVGQVHEVLRGTLTEHPSADEWRGRLDAGQRVLRQLVPGIDPRFVFSAREHWLRRVWPVDLRGAP